MPNIQDFKVYLLDPDQEPSDEALELLMREENIHREGLAVARPSVALRKHLAAISAIVTARRCENPRVFGSVLRGEDHIGSDLDLLVDATKGATLLDLGGLQHDLIGLLKVRVQVVTPGDLPEKWRQQVIDEAKPLDWFRE